MANLYNDSQQYELAERYYNIAINLNRTETNYYLRLAKFYLSSNREDKAKEILNEFQVLRPDDIVSFRQIGNYLLEFRVLDEALKYYNLVIIKDKMDLSVLSKISYIFLLKNELEKAKEIMDQITATNSKFSDNTYCLGLYNLKIKKIDSAMFYFERTLDIDKKHAGSLMELGSAFYHKEMYDIAIEYFEKSLDIDPNSSYVHYYLGLIYIALSKHDKAIGHLNYAKKLKPDIEKIISDKNLELYGSAREKKAKSADKKIEKPTIASIFKKL